jgi:hypothetical protein
VNALAELTEEVESPAEQRQLQRGAAFGLGAAIARNRPRPEPVVRSHMEGESRLPALGTIKPSTRQQVRRVSRTQVRCGRCGVYLVTGDGFPICFDDGRDAHKVCSEARNTGIIEALMQLKAQDGKPMTAEEAAPLVQKEIAGSKGK